MAIKENMSKKVTEKSNRDKRLLDFILTLLATLIGVVIAFQLDKYQETLREKEIYNEKLQNLFVEVYNNQTALAELKKKPLIYEENNTIHQVTPLYYMDTTLSESLLLDSQSNKYLDSQTNSILYSYVLDMKSINIMLNKYSEKVDKGTYTKDDNEYFKKDIDMTLELTNNFREIVDYLKEKYKVRKKYDKQVEDIKQKRRDIKLKYKGVVF